MKSSASQGMTILSLQVARAVPVGALEFPRSKPPSPDPTSSSRKTHTQKITSGNSLSQSQLQAMFCIKQEAAYIIISSVG